MNVTTKYECPVCNEQHGSEYLAESCCPREVKTVLVCGECSEPFRWYDKDKAGACCKKVVEKREELERMARVCFYCDEPATEADERDSKYLGSHTRCRPCILKVAPEVVAA